MAAPGREFVGYARHYWYDVLDLPGAWQMLNVRRLMESRPMLSRMPCQDIVLNPGDEYSHIVATKGDGYLMAYTPLGNEIELDGNLLPASSYHVSWFDPRSGKTIRSGTVKRTSRLQFTAPSRGPGFDWVLILDANN
jgi:hypothetical protein